MVVLNLLFLTLPKLDPQEKNYSLFKNYYYNFLLLLNAYLLYIHILILAWALGRRFVMGQMMTPALGILFFYAGCLMLKAKPNWFIGIRTPWTLSNETVWDKTHQLGGRLFQISGLIVLLGFVWPIYAIWFILVPILGSTVFLFIYSFIKYKEIKS
jgi:uncharacterized membrane protein